MTPGEVFTSKPTVYRAVPKQGSTASGQLCQSCRMIWKILLAIVIVVSASIAARHYTIYSGWQPIHGSEFVNDDCTVYHVMRGMEQDPARDPSNKALLEKCGTDYIHWSLSAIGDVPRFDRPARIRLRFDPVDMDNQHYESYPPLIVEFPYPPVAFPNSFRVRQWGGIWPADPATSAKLLKPYWSPPWAPLFAEWSLGRGTHEVWLGGTSITDPKYCERVEHNAQRNQDYCVMTLVSAVTRQPLPVKIPMKTGASRKPIEIPFSKPKASVTE